MSMISMINCNSSSQWKKNTDWESENWDLLILPPISM